MPSLPAICVFLSGGVITLLGMTHLALTFSGNKLLPRDPTLIDRMREISPVITSETTMWQCWIGFNASHSMGALLFGLIYGYLALVQAAMLLHSLFLGIAGGVFLGAYCVLGSDIFITLTSR